MAQLTARRCRWWMLCKARAFSEMLKKVCSRLEKLTRVVPKSSCRTSPDRKRWKERLLVTRIGASRRLAARRPLEKDYLVSSCISHIGTRAKCFTRRHMRISTTPWTGRYRNQGSANRPKVINRHSRCKLKSTAEPCPSLTAMTMAHNQSSS